MDIEAEEKCALEDKIIDEIRGLFADPCSKLDVLQNKRLRWIFASSIPSWRFLINIVLLIDNVELTQLIQCLLS